jgi:hypothetical protein
MYVSAVKAKTAKYDFVTAGQQRADNYIFYFLRKNYKKTRFGGH